MYAVYILKSLKTGKYYIGHSENLMNRICNHNSGLVKSTKFGCPWKLVHTENYITRGEAFKRELLIKSYKGGNGFKKLIK